MLHITLSSDFGHSDHAAAVIKGKLYAAFPDVVITDINHNRAPYQVMETVYHVKSAFPYFPKNTFHLIYADMYADPKQAWLYTRVNDQHLFAPNNGIMTQLFNDMPMSFYFLEEKVSAYNYINMTDVLIRQIDLIRQGSNRGLIPAHVHDMLVLHLAQPVIGDDFMEVRVLRVDEFGNVILDCTRKQLDDAFSGKPFKSIGFRSGEITTISQHYNDVPPGKVLCRFNTGGYLEIAINHGQAETLLGLSTIAKKELFYHKVKINF